MRVLLLATLALLAASTVSALNNGLGRTPPMGYNTWFDVGCSTQMNEGNVLAVAQSLVSSGLAALGYTFVNLDDCWASSTRNPQTHQQEASEAFSSGIASLTTQVHGLGLQLGLLTDRGEFTCNGRTGSLGYESLDAECYAGWGVDFVMEAGCNATEDRGDAIAQYASMRDALNATGRDIFFAINEGQAWYAPQAAALANSWRTGPTAPSPPLALALTDDADEAAEATTDSIIEPEESSADSATPWEAILQNIDAMAVGSLGSYAGPGGFNDPGLLLSADHTGRLLISENQTRAQMGQWAVMASPLLISGSLSMMSAYNLDTYSSAEVIRINQDPLGTQGVLVYSTAEGSLSQGASQIWAKQLVDGSFALHFLNAHPNETRSLRCDAQCFAQAGASLDVGWGIKVRDVWAQQDLLFTDAMDYTVSTLIPAGGSALLQFTWQPLSEEAQPGPMTPGDPHSTIKLDPSIQPRNHSTIPLESCVHIRLRWVFSCVGPCFAAHVSPFCSAFVVCLLCSGWGKYVEQCGEFVYRYFHTLGLNYPTMGQPSVHKRSCASSPCLAVLPLIRLSRSFFSSSQLLLPDDGSGREQSVSPRFRACSQQWHIAAQGRRHPRGEGAGGRRVSHGADPGGQRQLCHDLPGECGVSSAYAMRNMRGAPVMRL